MLSSYVVMVPGENQALFEEYRTKGYGINFHFQVIELPSIMIRLKKVSNLL
jgi:hypothetical protein